MHIAGAVQIQRNIFLDFAAEISVGKLGFFNGRASCPPEPDEEQMAVNGQHVSAGIRPGWLLPAVIPKDTGKNGR